jgi:ribose transport system substrate-binding protein
MGKCGYGKFHRLRPAAITAAVVLFVGACASTAGSVSSQGSGGSSGTKAATSTGLDQIVPPARCGAPVTYKRSPAEKALLAKLPAQVQSWYDSWSWQVKPTPWATFKGVKGPWKIGYITLPLLGQWHLDAYNQLKSDFAKAKAKGLVTGKLMTYIQTDMSTATADQQIQAIQQMVASGVNGLIVHPIDAQAEAGAIDAAGKAGVPVVIEADDAPNSVYAINNHANVNVSGASDLLKLLYNKGWFRGNKTYYTLYIRGPQGNSLEQAIHQATLAADSACPGVKSLGQLFTNWDNTTTKADLLQWLAAHPGQKIDFMQGEAGVTQGMLEAFMAAGRPIPPIAFNQSFGGDYSWWLAHKNTYQTIGDSFDGSMATYAEFRILLRILAGDGPKVNSIPLHPVQVTNANIAKYAKPGLKVSDPGSLLGPPDAAMTNAQLNYFFTKPGTPGGL